MDVEAHVPRALSVKRSRDVYRLTSCKHEQYPVKKVVPSYFAGWGEPRLREPIDATESGPAQVTAATLPKTQETVRRAGERSSAEK